jgi:hypothetical protein
MCLRNRYFFFLIFIVSSTAALGQAASTPFSTFGIGVPYGNALIQNHGMGGIGVSQPQYWSVNNMNPALLVYNYYTVFQAGALVESRNLKSDTVSQKSVNGNLNYLVIAFPVKAGKWATSVGLMPFTSVNYKLLYQDQVIDNDTGLPIDTVGVIEQGSGGINQFYWSNGVRLHEDWSVGIKASYLFGSVNTDYSNTLLRSSQTVPFIIAVNEQTYVKDFRFTGGLSFSKDSIGRKEDFRLSAGFVYNFSADLNAKKNTLVERRVSSGDPVTSDTLINNSGSINIPESFTVGVSLSKGVNWSAGIEFSAQDWSKTNIINEKEEELSKGWRISAGGEFTPDHLSASNYLKRVTYRVGMSYEKQPFLINNNQLKDLGINFGFSLPTGRSSVDWGVRIGKLGDKSKNVLEESYYKIYFGISFSDTWFIKRKFD